MLIITTLIATAAALECSEDADQCMPLGNATIERDGDYLYVECDSRCAVAVRGSQVNRITITEGHGAITLDHNIALVVVSGSEDADLIDVSGSPVPAEVDGGAGADTIIGTAFEDALSGGYGNDTIQGLDGDDHIRGGQGDDTLQGGGGLDTIIGGRGEDACLDAITARQCESGVVP